MIKRDEWCEERRFDARYPSIIIIILLLLLNLYSTHHMLTPRGALYYKVKISQWAARRCYTLPKINKSEVFCKKLSLTNCNVAQQESCSTALELQSQSYDRHNWCSLPDAQLSHHGQQICFDVELDWLQQSPTFPTDMTVLVHSVLCRLILKS